MQTQIGGYTQGYDGETRLKTSTVGGAATTYSYDRAGRRVVKQVGRAGPVTMVYDAGGLLAAEYGGTTEVGTQYLVVDALGSTRAVVGPVFRRMDYLPFGEETGAGSGVRQRFTGKERDGETGLDFFGARYYSGAQSRFTSPDAPFADQVPSDPKVGIYTRTLEITHSGMSVRAVRISRFPFSRRMRLGSFLASHL